MLLSFDIIVVGDKVPLINRKGKEKNNMKNEHETENKPFNVFVTELLTIICNQMNEYYKNGKTEQIETLRWVIEQMQKILK